MSTTSGCVSLLLLHLLTRSVVSDMAPEETLQCVCTTSGCQEMGEPICRTAGLCYTQFLDRKDGSDPITKGCANRKTPLLCENRRPKGLPRRAKWPILVCCRTPMCNQAHLPLDALVADDDVDDDDASRGGNETSENGVATPQQPPPPPPPRDDTALFNRKSLRNPAVLACFVIGLAALLAIGITGCCVLQRQQMY